MDKVNILRNEIDLIDKQIAKLFKERFEIVKQLNEEKRRLGKNIEDKEREKQIIEKAKSYIEDEKLQELYLELVNKELELSKRYQAMLK